MIGTIRGLTPLTVNGLRITPAPDVAVRIDDRSASLSDLALGHVVRVVGRTEGKDLAAARIDVTSEVVGPVDSAMPGRLIVLGQRVLTNGLAGDWRPGTRAAVFGLRRLDGVIVASLVRACEPGLDRVAGPVRRADDGAPMIGNLRLLGGEALHAGRRVQVTGSEEGGALRVLRAEPAAAPFPPGLWSVSVEAYLGRAGPTLALGSGLPLAGRPPAAVPEAGSVRALLTDSLGLDGGLTLEHLDVVDRAAQVDALASDLHYEPDRIDLRNLASPAQESPSRTSDGSRSGSRVLDTRPGGDISLPKDAAPLRTGGRPTPVGANGPVDTASGTRIRSGPAYPGAGGPEAPSLIPGFRR